MGAFVRLFDLSSFFSFFNFSLLWWIPYETKLAVEKIERERERKGVVLLQFDFVYTASASLPLKSCYMYVCIRQVTNSWWRNLSTYHAFAWFHTVSDSIACVNICMTRCLYMSLISIVLELFPQLHNAKFKLLNEINS